MHHATDRIAHATAFVTPVMEHWLKREIAQCVHPMKDRSDDPSHHKRTLLPQSYISLHFSWALALTTELHLALTTELRLTLTTELRLALTTELRLALTTELRLAPLIQWVVISCYRATVDRAQDVRQWGEQAEDAAAGERADELRAAGEPRLAPRVHRRLGAGGARPQAGPAVGHHGPRLQGLHCLAGELRGPRLHPTRYVYTGSHFYRANPNQSGGSWRCLLQFLYHRFSLVVMTLNKCWPFIKQYFFFLKHKNL